MRGARSEPRQLTAPFEYAQISVNADLDHAGGNFIAYPGLFAFAVADGLDAEDHLRSQRASVPSLTPFGGHPA